MESYCMDCLGHSLICSDNTYCLDEESCYTVETHSYLGEVLIGGDEGEGAVKMHCMEKKFS